MVTVLAPCGIIILDKLDKTVKIDIYIKVISRDIHSVTMWSNSIVVLYHSVSFSLAQN